MKRVRPALLLVAILFIEAASASCGGVIIGDPGHVVYLQNLSDTPVLVYEVSGTNKVLDGRVEARQTKKTAWLVPLDSSKKRTVEAYDDAGVLLFCRIYSFEELDRIGWRVEIVKGHNTCE